MDRLKNVKKYLELYRWKLDRAGYTEDIEWAIEEIERMEKEIRQQSNRVLIVYIKLFPTDVYVDHNQALERIIEQALKEGE